MSFPLSLTVEVVMSWCTVRVLVAGFVGLGVVMVTGALCDRGSPLTLRGKCGPVAAVTGRANWWGGEN